jgi:hypothetical protein
VGGLMEIAGVELNTIDALLYVWLVLAGDSAVYVIFRDRLLQSKCRLYRDARAFVFPEYHLHQ